MNDQKPLKPLNLDNDLYVNSIFRTIQGEGIFAGRPAVFVRLAGCNLQCPFCDTEYTETIGIYPLSIPMTLDLILAEHRTDDIVVITGGEPLRQSGLCNLVTELLKRSIRVQVETNGTLYQPLPFVNDLFTVICSPKTPKLNQLIVPYIDAYKYVIRAGEVAQDGLPINALGNGTRGVPVARPWSDIGYVQDYWDDYKQLIFVQPMDEGDAGANTKNLEACVQSCLEHGYTLGVQMHKLANIL